MTILLKTVWNSARLNSNTIRKGGEARPIKPHLTSMDRTERFQRILQIMESGQSVSKERFLEELEVSRATFTRDLEYLRERLGAPIEFDRHSEGYRLAKPGPGEKRFELPGIWFSASEAHALLTIYHLLENIQPDLLGKQIEPLMDRVRAILGSGDHSWQEIGNRIKVLPQASRRSDSKHFEIVSTAVLDKKKLRIFHFHRGKDERTERELSPQRLIHYRDNWYLDAWCHLREGLRSFAIDSIEAVQLLDEAAKTVSNEALDAEFTHGYGIFGGKPTAIAELRFSPESARWVANEVWHPDAQGEFDQDGFYVLKVPYSHPRELMMDVLKHGAGVEVLAPKELVAMVVNELGQARAVYG